MRTFDRFLVAVVIGAVLYLAWSIAFTDTARGHYKPGSHNVKHAINLAWCGKSNSVCTSGEEAWRVSSCETGRTYSVWANNGQYLGLFQVSAHWRRTIPGFAFNPWAQARHAHRIYVLTKGWSHWECRP